MSKKQPKKYRHPQQYSHKVPAAKPMSQRTKIILIICSAVMALAGIWYFFIYDDGSLPVKDGKVQAGGDNWVIVNRGTTSKPKYYGLAEVGPVKGYTRDSEETYKSDKNTTDFILRPDDKQSAVKYCYITGVTKSSKEACEYAMDAMGKQGGKDGLSEYMTGTIGGFNAEYIYSTSSTPDQAGKTQYLQSLNCYLPYDRENCILFNVTVSTDDPNNFLSDSQLLQIADEGARSVSLIIKE